VTDQPERYVTLDALRGIAALSVAVWHWQHFFYSSAAQRILLADPSIQPFSTVLFPFYARGIWGVDLFFAISGFVFFYLYSDRLAHRSVNGRQFAILRVTRLYPLHVVTLCLVAILQGAYELKAGSAFVYQSNDALRFGMHLLFASNWDALWPFSFNGPAWSVSIEVLLYALFFVVAWRAWTHPVVLGSLAAAGAMSMATSHFHKVGRGVLCFYLGALCFLLVRQIRQGYRPSRALLTGLALAIGGAFASHQWLKSTGALEVMVIAVVFPALIVCIAGLETRLKYQAHRFAWLGEISYSSYLLHFPLQLSLVTAASYLGIGLDPSSRALFLMFFVVLILVSLLSFRKFERPVQSYLRNRFLMPRPISEMAVPASGIR
jgi:peptidoglycan/LPS O-acetylase OafA/YrhL